MKKKTFKKLTSLSIVIPFYNEKPRLHLAFNNIRIFLKKNFVPKIEILFIDDGSTDKGNNLIKKYFEKFKKNKKVTFRLIKSKKNIGKGFAIKKGCLEAKNDWILTSDLDFSVPLSHIIIWFKKNFINNKINVYFGSRALVTSQVKSSQFRLFIGRVFRILIIFFLNIRIKDTQCGFKLYKSTAAKKIFRKLKMYGFDHDLEIVIISKKLNYKIVELPVKWHHVSQSKLSIVKDSFKMFLGILRLAFKK